MKETRNIVWLKRDLRVQDHAPLYQAETHSEDYIIIYIFEPSAMAYPDCSLRHLQFVYHSIIEMNQRLEKYGRCVLMFHAEALDVMRYLTIIFDVKIDLTCKERLVVGVHLIKD